MDDYDKLKKEIELTKSYASHFVVGKSEDNEEIIGFRLKGKKKGKKILIQGGMHAREYITSFFLCKLVRFLSGFLFCGEVVVVPLLNVDGVKICNKGAKGVNNLEYRKNVLKILKYVDKGLYKANARGVDLNVSFDTYWGEGKHNFFNYPNYENFIGFAPQTEREVKSLIKLTNTFNPDLTISYHSKGEVIYYGFKNEDKKVGKLGKYYSKIISKETKYRRIFTKNSCGGYKDYAIINKKIPSFTIEVGEEKLSHPISSKFATNIFDKNKSTVLKLLKDKEYDRCK